MNKRAGARQIDGKKSKKEKRLARLRDVERTKNQNEVNFTPLDGGLWEVSILPKTAHPQHQIESEKVVAPAEKKFDIRGFLDDVRSAIARRDFSKLKS